MIEQSQTLVLTGALRMLADRQRLFLTEGLELTLARVNQTFFDIADSSPEAALQTNYFDAMKVLSAQRKHIQMDVVERVFEAFSALMIAGASSPGLGEADSSGHLSLDKLALVEDDELEAIIVMDTMVSIARNNLHSRGSSFTGRLTTVLGRVLDPSSSPFDPEYLVNCFDSCSRQLGLGLQPRISLLKLFGTVVLAGLPDFLEESDALLEGLGVKPTYLDDSVDDLVEEEETPENEPLPEELVSTPPGVASDSAHGILDRASSRLMSELPESIKAQVDEASQDVEYPRLSVAVTRLLQVEDVEAANTGPSSIHEQIGDELARQGQSFEDLHPLDRHLIDLMDTLFEQAGKRQWSSAVLSDLLGKVELPAVNLAVSDAAFLDREYHPARRLFNELAAVASHFQAGSEPVADPLYQKIEEVVGCLRGVQNDTRRLTDLLSEFIEAAEKDRLRCARLSARTMEEVLAKEKTNKSYEQVEQTLKSRVCGGGQPLFLIDFVEQAWCKVMFLAYVKHGVESPEWLTGVHLLDQLVGLVGDPESADMEYVRKLLAALETSLEHIAYDRFESSRLLRQVKDFFVAGDTESSLIVLEKGEARDAEQYFAQVLVNSLDLAIPGEPGLMEEDLAAQLADRDLSRVDSITQGSWVEFRNVVGEPVCGRLLGVIPSSDKFVFGDRVGNKVAEAHRYRLALAMKEGNLVLLDNSHLFDQALSEAFELVRQKAG